MGIVPRRELWSRIQQERWYHIPVKSAPQNTSLVEYIAFYFPKIFDKEYQYQVNYYAKVLEYEIKKRIELFPKEPKHQRAMQDYFQFHLGLIQKLPRSIPSKRWRYISHIPTSLDKLLMAKEINDLWDTSPLEEKMYQEMKKRKIETERQLYVKVGGQIFCLDFGIFCKKGNIDLECDGERYHTLPEALARDRKRNNQLTSFGWRVLRFSGKEISQDIGNCLRVVERTIGTLGGLGKIKIETLESHCF
ncbi:MAG TPA: DUF559 domain-containing protein [Candidatus Woesebacteria bacterium]|nr:DUF559 domain-containing protein [Candidatus Woesebacteria bacterium]HRT39996.1 DUF559 domain-containing protein [Candidatus Woesebacteria bacterium]